MAATLNPNLGFDLLLDADGDLALSPQNDLTVTPNGRLTLLQDVLNCIRLTPGDLYTHPASGAGVFRQIGENENADLLVRMVGDALIYDEMIAQRIDQSSIVVARVKELERPGKVVLRISFSAITDGTTNNYNMIYNPQTGEIENLS